MSKCDHIIGEIEGQDRGDIEPWNRLLNMDEPVDRRELLTTHFRYCPMCGDILESVNKKERI